MMNIEDTWPYKFKDEVCSLLLSITIDGVNPYSQLDNTYTICPIVVINKNTPPWLSVKNEYIMLSLIVLVRRQMNNIVVYLQPLIKKFKELWKGLQVYDVSRPIPS